MAITNSTTQNIANSAVNALESNLSATPIASEVKDGLQTAESLATGFSTIFSLLQAGEGGTQSGGLSLPDSAGEDFISSMQESVLGTLGIASTGEGSIEDKLKSLTDSASIEKLQAAFLSTLQQNLFSPQNATAQGATNASASAAANTTVNPVATATPAVTPFAQTTTAGEEPGTLAALESLSFGKDGLGLADGFDVVNILNHVPVVSELYKQQSGTDVSLVSKLAGGYLYGGPLGLAFSAIDVASESVFDNTLSGLLTQIDYASMLTGDESGEAETKGEEPQGVTWKNRYIPENKE